MQSITLYHGSQDIIKDPIYKGSSAKNDFGSGFYCTDQSTLANEWAASLNGRGYVNEYQLDTADLSIFKLIDYDYLTWIAVLLKNRDIETSIPRIMSNVNFIIDHYYPKEIEKADIVIGYRADNSYFTWVKDFVQNAIDLDSLNETMCFNNLGLQYFLQSKKAFESLKFVQSHKIESNKYFDQRKRKEIDANHNYIAILDQHLNDKNSIYASDLPKIVSINSSHNSKNEITEGKYDDMVHDKYLENKSKQLGVFFDAAINVYAYSVEEAQELFLTSKYPPYIEDEDPLTILGLTGLDLLNKIQFKKTNEDMDYSLYDSHRSIYKSEEYWAGWILSHYQDYSIYPFQDILAKIPLSRIIEMYYPLHEADVHRSYYDFDALMDR